ncbi:MAG: DUF1846 domain-containing protein [Rectinemataceae bacterium]
MQAKAFDNEKYLAEQAAFISARALGTEKLYLEFGGKLLWDWHAARVLPGYDPNVKIRLLSMLKDKAEVILCIYAGDIERKRMRGDFGITYDASALQIFDQLGDWGVSVAGVVITRFEDQPAAEQFGALLERRGVRIFRHRPTKGYPNDVESIVSAEGYGSNEYIPTSKPIVVVTGPGPGSGKLATALSLVYADHIAGRKASYAKFETFPVWNLPLKHPANIAYEAATVDLAGIPKKIHLLPPVVTASIASLKRDVLGRKSVSLSLDEALIALSVSAAMNPSAQVAMEALKSLAGCELHLTHIPATGDEVGLRRLGLNATSDPFFAGNNLFHS